MGHRRPNPPQGVILGLPLDRCILLYFFSSMGVYKGNPVVFVFQIKCHQYYPVGEENEGDDEIIFTEVGLKVTFLSEQIVNYHYIVRMLEIKDLQVFFVR